MPLLLASSATVQSCPMFPCMACNAFAVTGSTKPASRPVFTFCAARLVAKNVHEEKLHQPCDDKLQARFSSGGLACVHLQQHRRLFGT
ncbi:hypothetical protein HDF11_004804 [Tunturiibacter psychrotolerans]